MSSEEWQSKVERFIELSAHCGSGKTRVVEYSAMAEQTLGRPFRRDWPEPKPWDWLEPRTDIMGDEEFGEMYGIFLFEDEEEYDNEEYEECDDES